MSVPDNWVSSVGRPKYTPGNGIPLSRIPRVPVFVRYRNRYRSKHSSMVRYQLDSGSRHFGKFGTTSIPVPDTCCKFGTPTKNTPNSGIPYRTYPWIHYFAGGVVWRGPGPGRLDIGAILFVVLTAGSLSIRGTATTQFLMILLLEGTCFLLRRFLPLWSI